VESNGTRVVLRPLDRSDLQAVVRWDEDGEIIRWMGKKFPTRWSLVDWFRRVRAGLNHRALAIETPDGSLIGTVELHHIAWRQGLAELTVCIGERVYWGKGYGTAAVQAVLPYAFGRLGLRHLYLRVYADNARAIRCYEKCGFRKTAVLRLGRRRPAQAAQPDLILMSLNRDAYRARLEAGTGGRARSGEAVLEQGG